MFAAQISDLVWSQLSAAYRQLDEPTAKKVAAELSRWLVEEARKKDLPDLQDRLTDMLQRIEKLARSLVFKLDGTYVYVWANGDAQATLTLLDRGSDWFVGHPNLSLKLAKIVFDEHEHYSTP
jgi:hypothetical protein